MKFDTLVVITPEDFERLKSQYKRLVDNLKKSGADRVIFVGSVKVRDKIEECGLSDKADFLNEDDIIPFSEVHEIMEKHMSPLLEDNKLPRGITGWYYQQFLKMQYALISNNKYYMSWDGDTIPCKPFDMFDQEETPYIDLKTEHHAEYFETMGKLIPGLKKCIDKSFISEHMLFDRDIMKRLIVDIESNEAFSGNRFYEKIINAIEPEKIQSSSFSEFETYGSYVCVNYTNKYKLRNWHSFRLAGEFFDLNTIEDKDYNWLSKDFYAISFEKGHFVREDHRNLFDNPEYQKKMSARKMLEIAQEEFKDGYIEVWDDDSNEVTKKPDNQPVIDYRFMYYNNLGDYYENINPDKAYLSYEQAYFVCKDDNLKNAIKNKMDILKTTKAVSVRKTAIVIVSYNSSYLMEKCLESIRDTVSEQMADIIVVDNGSTDGVTEYLENQKDIILIKNDENVGFPKGCNIGIDAADNGQDIFLLNNDTRLCRDSLYWLRMGLYENEKVGATGAVANYCGSDQLVNVMFDSVEKYISYGEKINTGLENPYEEKNRLCGFALLLKREALDRAGKLDEMFSPGYFEDDDITLGIHSLGYKLYVCHNAFIYHAGSQNFIKRNDLDEIMERNHKYITEKWGYDVLSYSVVTETEASKIERINHGRYDMFKLLEVGCGSGNCLTRIKYRYPNADIYGIEKEEGAVWNSVGTVTVFMSDFVNDRLPFPEQYFDYIIYNDRFGDGPDKEEACKILGKYLKSDGQFM